MESNLNVLISGIQLNPFQSWHLLNLKIVFFIWDCVFLHICTWLHGLCMIYRYSMWFFSQKIRKKELWYDHWSFLITTWCADYFLDKIKLQIACFVLLNYDPQPKHIQFTKKSSKSPWNQIFILRLNNNNSNHSSIKIAAEIAADDQLMRFSAGKCYTEFLNYGICVCVFKSLYKAV